MASFGGGVTITMVKHLMVDVDVGYKYSRIFIANDYLQEPAPTVHQHSGINVHRMYFGVGYAF